LTLNSAIVSYRIESSWQLDVDAAAIRSWNSRRYFTDSCVVSLFVVHDIQPHGSTPSAGGPQSDLGLPASRCRRASLPWRASPTGMAVSATLKYRQLRNHSEVQVVLVWLSTNPRDMWSTVDRLFGRGQRPRHQVSADELSGIRCYPKRPWLNVNG